MSFSAAAAAPVAGKEGGTASLLDGWTACGSCEAARFGEEVEASDSMDNERCLLRLFVESCAVNEGGLEGDGGVSIALVVVVGAKAKYKNPMPLDTAAYSPEAPNLDAHVTAVESLREDNDMI